MGYSKHELSTINMLHSLKKLSSYTPTSPSASYLCPRGGRCGEGRLHIHSGVSSGGKGRVIIYRRGSGGEDLGLNKVQFSRFPLWMLLQPPNNVWWLLRFPPSRSSFSKQIWVVPLWILPKFPAIPPFGFSVMTDPPFCSPKNQVFPPKILRSPAINNDRSLIDLLIIIDPKLVMNSTICWNVPTHHFLI